MVKETFSILQDLRNKGVTILMVEQNARSALEISDHALVLELGQTRMSAPAHQVLHDSACGAALPGRGDRGRVVTIRPFRARPWARAH